MGAINSALYALNQVSTALGAVNAVRGTFGAQDMFNNEEEQRRQNLRAQQDLALRQLQAQQGLQQQVAAEDAALSREERQAQTQAAEEARRASLRRAMARQRAQFGASGVGSQGGSSEAVLLGLFEESDADRTTRERLDNIRNRALDQGLSSRQRLNVLQRSQLEERQKLDRLMEGS